VIDPVRLGEPTATIVAFLERIGIAARRGAVGDDTFLPGIAIEWGELRFDPERLRYPGDVLHEAGHLAVMPPGRRARAHGILDVTLGDEMMAIGWSYAAARQAGIDPAVVFHEGGYRGASAWFLDLFASGNPVALPALQWVGLTTDAAHARELGCEPYPAMRAWLNDGSVYRDET
jgi:hypothetical protein